MCERVCTHRCRLNRRVNERFLKSIFLEPKPDMTAKLCPYRFVYFGIFSFLFVLFGNVDFKTTNFIQRNFTKFLILELD